MDTLKIIMEYLININYINIIYITENSPNISEKTENEVMDFLIKNYILTKWEYLFTNKSDLWFMQEFVKLIKNTDDLNIYKYFLNDIYLYMQIINIYLENIYINIIMPNKYINIIKWYIHKDELLNKNHNINIYSNNLLELLKEINEKDAYINNINKKKNKLMLINKNILLDTYIRPIIYEKFEKWWPKYFWENRFIYNYGASYNNRENIINLIFEYIEYDVNDSSFKWFHRNIYRDFYWWVFDYLDAIDNGCNPFTQRCYNRWEVKNDYKVFMRYEFPNLYASYKPLHIAIKKVYEQFLEKNLWIQNKNLIFIQETMSYLNKFKNNYVEIADYRLFYLGLDYDLKIKEYNINQKEINEKMQINDFIYLRKNNYKIKSNIIIDKKLRFLIKKVLIAENAFKELTGFEKWINKNKLRYGYKKSFLWFSDNNFIFGKKGVYAKSRVYLIKKWYKHILLFKNEKIYKIYSNNYILPKGFKFFGGYTYWYAWFQDYKYENERYLGQIRKWIRYFRLFRWKLRYEINWEKMRRMPAGRYPDFKGYRNYKFWAQYRKNATFEQITRMSPNFSKRLFKGFILSEDIWNTKTFLIQKFSFKKSLIKLLLGKKKYMINILENPNYWFKELLIRKPTIIKSQKILYGTNEKKYKLLASNFLIEFPKTEIKIESTKDIIWVQKLIKFWQKSLVKFVKIRKPYGFLIFPDEIGWTEDNKGFMDIKTKQLLRISDRGLILMNKSKIYKNKIEIAIQGFWIKEFSKDFINSDIKKFFISEKLRLKKIIIEEFYKYIKDNNNNILINSMYNNYYVDYNNYYNKDLYYYENFDKSYENLFINKFWEKNFEKSKKKFIIKNNFWDIYFKNIIFKKEDLLLLKYMTLIKKKINILKKTMLYIPYNKRFIFKINIDNSIVIMRKYKKQVYIKNIIDLYKEINIIEFLKKNQKDVKYFKLDNSSIKAKFLKYNIEFIMTISKSFLWDGDYFSDYGASNNGIKLRHQRYGGMSLLYEDLYIANENIIYQIDKLNNLLEKLKQIYVKNPNNNYYNIYWKNIENKNNVTKINLKTEYLININNIQKKEELFYKNYLMLKLRWEHIEKIKKNIIKIINFYYFGVKDDVFWFFFNEYTFKIFLIFFIFLLISLYICFNFLIILLILTSKPFENVYSVATKANKKISIKKIIKIWKILKNKKDDNYLKNIIEKIENKETINIEDLLKDLKKQIKKYKKKILRRLKIVLNEDITFGTEQKFIYSIWDKKNPQMRIKLYDKYTKKIKKKIRENYKIIYKNYITEESIAELSNNIKLKFKNEDLIKHYKFFKKNKKKKTSLKEFIILVGQYLKDKYYNYGYLILKENEDLNSTRFNFYIKIPRSIIWRRIRFYIKLIFAIIKILMNWISVYILQNIRAIVKYVYRLKYYVWFKGNLVIKSREWIGVEEENFQDFLNQLGTKKSITWWDNKFDLENFDSIVRIGIENIHNEIDKTQIKISRSIHYRLKNYLEKKIEEAVKIQEKMEKKRDLLLTKGIWTEPNDDLKKFLLMLTHLAKVFKEKEQIIEIFLENILFLFKSAKNQKLILNTNTKEMELLKFYLNYVESKFFKTLLEIVKDDKKLHEDLKLIFDNNIKNEKLNIINKFQEIDWFQKKWNTYHLEKEKLIESKQESINKKIGKEYLIYQWFTNIGTRFYYLMSLITTLSIIWVNSIKKVREDHYNINNIIKIFHLDIKKLYIKMYWEYNILTTDLKWIERKEKKKIKIEAIKKWFSFFWIIIIPISNYIVILIILYLIYYNIYIIIKTLKNYINNKYIIYIKNKKIYPIIIFIKNIISFFIFCIKFIFIDLKTGKNILMSIYINLHIFLGNFQLNIFYLKNAYKKGVFEKNKKLGIYYMYIWLKLKCIVEVENLIIWILKKIKKFLWKQKKKIKKKYFNTILINLNIKLSILWLLIQNHKNLQELKIIIIIFIKNIIYIIINKYIINYFEKNILDIYIYVYLNIIKQIKKYIKKKWDIKKEELKEIVKNYKKLNKKKKMVFWIAFFIKILTFLISYPIIIIGKIINYHYNKSWDKKIRLPISLKKWIDNIIRDHVLLYLIGEYKKHNIKSRLELFLELKSFKYQLELVIIKGKYKYLLENAYIDWKKWHIYFVNTKEHILKIGHDLIYKIELDYINFDKKLGKKHWSPYKRLKEILKKMYIKEKKYKKLLKMQNNSRNKFFYRKWKDRNKVIRRYLIKGLINWISYIFFKKVIFKKIKELKKQTIYINLLKRNNKYIIKNINSDIHFTTKLSKIPPQLWFLTILYSYYYKGIIFYFLNKEEPVYYKKLGLVPETRGLKWAINPYWGEWELGQQSYLAYCENISNGESYNIVLSRKPENVALKYLMFIIESQTSEIWTKEKAWSDISTIFSNLYNSFDYIKEKKDDACIIDSELKFEGKVMPEGKAIDLNYSDLKEDYDVLLRNFEKEKRLKNLFILKVATDVENIKRTTDTKEQEDLLIHEKRIMFGYFGEDFDEDIGIPHWRDLVNRLFRRWSYERHIIHVKNTLDFLSAYDIEEIDDLMKTIMGIYYDITITELISSIKIYMNWKKKEPYFELIEIVTEPTINIYLNYAQYNYVTDEKAINELKDFYRQMGSPMEFDKKLDYIFEKHKLEKDRNIKLEVLVNDEDLIVKNEFVHDVWFLNKEAIFSEYNHAQEKELLEQMRIHQKFTIMEQNVLSADLIYIWDKTISKRIVENIEKLKEEKDVELNLLKARWENSERAWYNNNKEIQNIKLKNPLIFINMLKLSWEQYLSIDISEKEKIKLKKKNTIFFNEKYNIWYLKLLPIRVKLPVQLEYPEEVIKRLLKRGPFTRRARFLYYPWFMVKPFVKELTQWQILRNHLKKKYNKDLQEIFFILTCPDEASKEDLKIANKFKELYDVIKQVYELTQNIAEIRTMIKVGWDWTYYYKIWEEIEEFTHTEWFTMRLRDFARDSIEIRYWMDNYPHAIYVIFDPDKYITWFYGFKQYRFLKYIAIICWIWIFYYIMYCPGELFYNTWYVIIPWWVSIYFIFLWQYIKKFLNERQKGKDLYLYKYQAKKRTTAKERGLKPYHYTVEKWQEHKKQYSLEGSEGAWETNRSVNLKDNFNTFRREFIIPVMFLFFIIRDFYAETWRFRTFSGYDYYKKYDPEAFMNRLGSNSYTRRHFKMDSWDRIEYGGNVYNVFYINYYRKNKGWKNRILDKGLYKTDPELYNVPFNFDNHIVKIIMNESDFGYFYYSLQYKKMFSEIQWKLKAKNKEETDDEDDATVNTAETNIDDTAGMYKGIHGYQLLRKLYKDFHGNWKMDIRQFLYLDRRKKRMVDFYEYYDMKHVYKDFILNAKKKTMKLMIKNKNDYFYQKEKIIEKKRKAYDLGEYIPFEHLINVSEIEKHKNILWFNFMKYKFYRNMSTKFKDFDEAQKTFNYILTLDFEKAKNLKLYTKDTDWSIFALKINKLNKYIINFNIKENKLKYIIDIFTKKLENEYDLYERILRFLKIISTCTTKEDLINIYIEFIKYFL